MLAGYMSLVEFVELVDFIEENHSFKKCNGKRIKYISPTFDTRTGKIFHIELRLSGEGKHFSITNENKHRNLNEWVRDWLENGSWKEDESVPSNQESNGLFLLKQFDGTSTLKREKYMETLEEAQFYAESLDYTLTKKEESLGKITYYYEKDDKFIQISFEQSAKKVQAL